MSGKPGLSHCIDSSVWRLVVTICPHFLRPGHLRGGSAGCYIVKRWRYAHGHVCPFHVWFGMGGKCRTQGRRGRSSEVGKLQDIYLYTVDDLKTVVDANLRGRELAAEAALEIVNLEVTLFDQWLKTHQSADQIRQLRDGAELVKQQAIEKALAQLAQSADPEQAMHRLANEITNKLLHKPTIEMRKALQQGDEERIKLLKSLIAPDPN